MNLAIRNAYETELRAASIATIGGEVEVAFHHLERAHILSQRYTSALARGDWSINPHRRGSDVLSYLGAHWQHWPRRCQRH